MTTNKLRCIVEEILDRDDSLSPQAIVDAAAAVARKLAPDLLLCDDFDGDVMIEAARYFGRKANLTVWEARMAGMPMDHRDIPFPELEIRELPEEDPDAS